jgi:hypothetical protein
VEARALTAAVALALHDDLVGVVGEAVEGTLDQDGVIEEGGPLVDSPVGGDDGGGAAVALDDDLVEVAGVLGIEAAQAEVVEDEEVGSQEAAHDPLGGVVGPGLVDESQEGIAAEEQNAAPGAAGGVPQGAGEEGLSNAHGTEEEDILVAVEEAEAEEVSDPVPVEGDGGVPVEVFEGVGLLEASCCDPGGASLPSCGSN